MKRTRFIEQRIASILRQAEEGTAVGGLCRKAGISKATYYNRRKKQEVWRADTLGDQAHEAA